MLSKRLLIVLLAASAWILPVARAAAKDDSWVQVSTPNFRIISNAGEKKAEQVAVQFETIRAVFRKALTIAAEHPTPVITVLAVKDEKSLSEVLPEYWKTKGHSHPTGLFYSGLDKTYVAVRVDANDAGAYETIYHEYYHSLTVPYVPGMPVWVLEGTAEFFGHTQIVGKQVRLGEPDPNLLAFLQQERMPLSLLMQVDESSPYYNEQNKTSIFYAESWALIHYFMLGDDPASHKQFQDFLQRLGDNETAEQATRGAFGDLSELQKRLNSYMARSSYSMFTMSTPEIDAKNFPARQVSEPEIDAILGDSFVRRHRLDEAEPLLKKSLELDPKSAFAHESYGLLEYARGNREQAEHRLREAIELNSDDYLTYYYHARLVDEGQVNGEAPMGQMQSDLQHAIALNPNFAPSYSMLALSEAARPDKWSDALKLSQQAIQLEPGNLILRLNFGQLLMRMNHVPDAVKVVETAKLLARTAQERSETDAFIASIQQYLQASNSHRPVPSAPNSEEKAQPSAPETTSTGIASSPGESGNPTGSVMKVTEGNISEDSCSRFELYLVLTNGSKSWKLHAGNYAKVEYWTFAGNMPGNFNPCGDLKGMNVRISYNAAPGSGTEGEIQKIEIQGQRSLSPAK